MHLIEIVNINLLIFILLLPIKNKICILFKGHFLIIFCKIYDFKTQIIILEFGHHYKKNGQIV